MYRLVRHCQLYCPNLVSKSTKSETGVVWEFRVQQKLNLHAGCPQVDSCRPVTFAKLGCGPTSQKGFRDLHWFPYR